MERKSIVDSCFIVHYFNCASLCDPQNSSKVDVVITILLRALEKARKICRSQSFSAASLEPHQGPVPEIPSCSFPSEKGRLPLLVWNNDVLAPRILTARPAGGGDFGCSVGDCIRDRRRHRYTVRSHYVKCFLSQPTL